MKEINCNIANDLMPLYVDDVLSEDSRKMLEQHISECPDCKETLEKMNSYVPVAEDKDIKPLKKVRKKLLVRTVLIIFLLIMVAATYIACETIWIPVKYVGDDLINDMEVVFMEDGVFLKRENLSARGDIIFVENNMEEGIVKFYIGENVPDHFRFAWYERTCYTQLVGQEFLQRQEIKEVDYCDKDGNILYTLWKSEE